MFRGFGRFFGLVKHLTGLSSTERPEPLAILEVYDGDGDLIDVSNIYPNIDHDFPDEEIDLIFENWTLDDFEGPVDWKKEGF